MDRAAATTYLTEEYRELAANAKFSDPQTTAAYNTAIDMSLRQLGTAEADLASTDVADSKVLRYIACLNYYALLRFSRLLSIQFDVTLPGPVQAARSQAFKQVKTMIDDAAAELASFGIIVGGQGASAMQLGRLTLDFLEPSCATNEFGGL